MSNWPKISSYFSEDSYNHEKNTLFNNGPQYVGHKLMVKNPDDYAVVSHTFDRYALFNLNGDYKLISNVCPHRQAKLLTGCGKTKNITCKLHCWTFANTGELKGTPHFTDKVDTKLEKIDLYEWNGLLFKNKAPDIDLKAAGVDHLINFNDYMYAGTESEHYNFNWKSFMEIYLENYHVFSMHPGLKKFVTPADLEWVFGEDYSIQKVGIGKDFTSYGTEIYKDWQKSVMDAHQEGMPRYGAIWMLIYPNIMIEWYPNTLVVSTVYPTGPNTCVNHVEFYYPEQLFKENPSYFENEKRAYMETAQEDNEACLLLEEGRKSLYLNNHQEYGPIDSFLEAGVDKFYTYIQTPNL
jgi:choline monooxygenase